MGLPVMCKVGVFGLIEYNDHILLIRDVEDNHTLGLPGGTIEEGEDFDSALQRELLEETGIQPHHYTYEKFHIYHEHPGQSCLHFYRVSLKQHIEKFYYNEDEISEVLRVHKDTLSKDVGDYRRELFYNVIMQFKK